MKGGKTPKGKFAIQGKLQRLERGPQFIRDFVNYLATALETSQPIPGLGVTITEQPTGRLITATGAGGGAAAEEWGFQGYESPYTGSGEAPPNQALKLRIRPADVSGIVPSNCFQEFTVPAGRGIEAPQIFWVKTTHDTGGAITGAEIGQGVTLPTVAAPGVGEAPATQYRAIFTVQTSATGIVKIDPSRKGSFDAHPVVTAVGCKSNTKEIQFS